MNEPAFPAMHYDLADNEHGLTMRDYFAAMAMQGLLAAGRDAQYGCDTMGRLAASSYSIANEMMKAREA
jgi:hypothetical protein